MDEKTNEKLAKLQGLIKKKEDIDREISLLLAPEKVVALPPDFSLNNEVLALVKEAGASGVASKIILQKLKDKYPDYGIERKRVASSLTYLKGTKKAIEIIGHGVYRAVVAISKPAFPEIKESTLTTQ